MKLPLSWLNEFININATPEKIAEALTLSGSEAEHISRRMPEELARFDKVVVGQILEIQKHPNADKLQIATVRISQLKTKDARFKHYLRRSQYRRRTNCASGFNWRCFT